jgi:hypothetical protein
MVVLSGAGIQADHFIMEDRKKEEFRILRLFRKCYADFPKGVLSSAESPDFILSPGRRKKIGLELTRLQRVSSGDPFSFENINKCLQSKEDKLPLYRQKRLQEYWLILVDSDPDGLPAYNLYNKLSVWKFESGFDRIFLFNPLGCKVYPLECL